MRIKYVAPFFDGSGYAEAARGYVLALHKAGVEVTISPVSFDKQHPGLGEAGRILGSLVDKYKTYDVCVAHLTPEHYPAIMSGEPSGVKKIGLSVWETSAIPELWVESINKNLDGSIVPSQWNADVYRGSGVINRIESVPHVVDFDFYARRDPIDIDFGGRFVFYTIAQYTERKNIPGLIRAFLYAFPDNDGVCLVIKTYGSDYSAAEMGRIKSAIAKVRADAGVKGRIPPIYVIHEQLSRNEIAALHSAGNCFVSLHRGEGFGLPIFEAIAAGNPVITTKFGGHAEYLDSKDGDFLLIDYSLTPVFGMPWIPWYTIDQVWAEPNLLDAAHTMRSLRDRPMARKDSLGDVLRPELSADAVASRFMLALNAFDEE